MANAGHRTGHERLPNRADRRTGKGSRPLGEDEEGAVVTLTPVTVRRLYIAALCIGVVAALLMTFVPPSVSHYTKEGGGVISFFNAPTTKGKFWGQLQWFLSSLGPTLLGVSFLLQLLAILAQPAKQ